MASNITTIDDKKKKPKGRYVASRYLQAAGAYSGNSSQSSEDTKIKGNVTKRTTKPFRQANTTVAKSSKELFASTPATSGSIMPPSLEESVIPEAQSYLCAPSIKEALTTRRKSPLKVSQTKSESCAVSADVGQKHRQAAMEEEMDILYAEYLQATLLAAKSKKALERRSKEAVKQILEVWRLLSHLLGKVKSGQHKSNVFAYMIKLHEHLQTQEKMILPVLELTDKLEAQYKEIALSVDSFKHKLSATDVMTPDNNSLAEILKTVEEIHAFMMTVVESIQNYEEIVSSSHFAKEFASESKVIEEDIERTSALLSEAKNILLDETSWKLDLTHINC